jgi:hypothetical protein
MTIVPGVDVTWNGKPTSYPAPARITAGMLLLLNLKQPLL